MSKLDEHDRFQIEALIRKIDNYLKSSDKKLDVENLYSKTNKEIAEFIAIGLEAWYDIVTSGYKGFSPMENQLYQDCRAIISKLLTNNSKFENNQDVYFSQTIISELINIHTNTFSLAKLIRILEEVNICYSKGCYLSVSSLLRMLIDHIPPIFGKLTFKEVVNNHNFSRSDKGNMEHLLGALKNISDSNLHTTISKNEVLPNKLSIEFRSDFEVLLKNIIIILKQ